MRRAWWRAGAARSWLLTVLLALGVTGTYTMANEPAVTTYGDRNPQAPEQLKLFSFLVGKWKGAGRTRLPNGSHAQFDLTWIGRYILNGVAIADEIHSLDPEGKPYLGITLRQFDPKSASWIIEYLNVSGSFIRRQVNPQSGAVSADNGTIVVISDDAQTKSRERYRVMDQSHFTYRMDMSRDGGKSWDTHVVEMTMTRVE